MPQQDRYVKRLVSIEFEADEKFTRLPSPERVSLVLFSNGAGRFELNGKDVALNAPCMLLISHYDKIMLVESAALSAASFHFSPMFLNSSLTFKRLAHNSLREPEDEHDRNMLNMFLLRDKGWDGAIELSQQAYLRISEWFKIIGAETCTQSDSYWPCRIRRYLLQTLFLLNDYYMNRVISINLHKRKNGGGVFRIALSNICTRTTPTTSR
ncbi:MAG: hypothetical protein LBS91_04675 [Clostridiales Family XIII bacterium]|jgi:hypothetical protein|nr:hypothetical protein [Clostridiales Family XIII bacterium]